MTEMWSDYDADFERVDEEAEYAFEESHFYATIDDFESLLRDYGVEFVFERMSAEGFETLKAAFLGNVD